MSGPALQRLPCFEFCTTVLGLRLSAAQRILLRVSIDGVEPQDLPEDDRRIARQLFGEIDVIPESVRLLLRILVWSLGRGSGKSTLAGAIAVWAMWTGNLDRVGPGQVPAAVVVSPTKATSSIAVGIARELVRRSPLEAYVEREKDTAEGFRLRRPDGRVVAFRSVAASRGGANLRGFDIIVLIGDESEFFASNDQAADEVGFAVSDRDQLAAAMPRLLLFVLFISTPWPTPNLTAELIARNFGHPTDALVAVGASTLMRPDNVQLARDVERELVRDEESARREFFCERGESERAILAPADVAVMDRDLYPGATPLGCGAGICDFSKGTDACICVFGQFISEPCGESEYVTEEKRNSRGELIMRDAWVYDSSGKPLVNPKWTPPVTRLWISGILAFERGFNKQWSYAQIVEQMVAAGAAYGIRHFHGDEWGDYQNVSEFSRHGCTFHPHNTTAKGKGESAAMLARLARERTIVLEPGPEADKAKREMLAARIVYRAGGIVTFESKRSIQGHGDRLSAITLAARLCAEGALEGNPIEARRGFVGSYDPYGKND